LREGWREGGSKLASCVGRKLRKGRGRGGSSSWEEGRRKFLNDRGMWVEGEGERGGEEETRLEEMVRWEREVQRAERWERIRESRYNK